MVIKLKLEIPYSMSLLPEDFQIMNLATPVVYGSASIIIAMCTLATIKSLVYFRLLHLALILINVVYAIT